MYIKMVVIVVFGLAILFAIQLTGKYVPVIPSFIISLLIAIDILVVTFMCYFIYLDIQQRDPLNFNELYLVGPDILTPDQIKASMTKAQASGDLLGSVNLGQCIGVACCSDGTVWDDTHSYCVPALTDGSMPASSGTTPSLPTGTPSLPAGTPSLPAGTPSLPAGTPSLSAGASSLLTGTPSLSAGTPSLPAGTPSPPAGTPSLPSGTPSLPSGTPSLPAGTPSLPAGTPSLPSGTPSLPAGVNILGFTTISSAYKTGDLIKDFVKPWSPNEFEQDSKI
jgi:hypothetical protein